MDGSVFKFGLFKRFTKEWRELENDFLSCLEGDAREQAIKYIETSKYGRWLESVMYFIFGFCIGGLFISAVIIWENKIPFR